MHYFYCFLTLLVLQSVRGTGAEEIESELPDFEFDGEPIQDYDYSDYGKSIEKMDSMIDNIAEEDSNTFAEKEKRIRDALLRSTKDKQNIRTFTQILPILRSLSKPQRLALAAIISAQSSAKPGAELSLDQVRFSLSTINYNRS